MASSPCSASERLLSAVPKGGNVAVVSMLGSLCPITLGHVACYEEARKIIMADPSSHVDRPKRLEDFHECLGLVSLNGDGHVMSKVATKGQTALSYNQRVEMVRVATSEHDWLNFKHGENTVEHYRHRFPDLNFIEFDMNGADDVAKYRKWNYVKRSEGRHRMFVMGRPGFTHKVLQGMKDSGLDPDDGHLIVGPELPDISSTAARDASKRGDVTSLLSIVHPSVASVLLKRDGHEGLSVDEL